MRLECILKSMRPLPYSSIGRLRAVHVAFALVLLALAFSILALGCASSRRASAEYGAIRGIVSPQVTHCLKVFIWRDRLADGTLIDSLRSITQEDQVLRDSASFGALDSDYACAVVLDLDNSGGFSTNPIPEGYYTATLGTAPGEMCPPAIGEPYVVYDIRVRAGYISLVTLGIDASGIDPPRYYRWKPDYVK